MGETANKNILAIGFTGTKLGMTRAQQDSVYKLLKKFYPYFTEFHHGDCLGADIEAASLAHTLEYVIVCHPPIETKTRGWFPKNTTINPEFDYIIRDQHIVDESRILIGTPHTPYEIVRSGTWTTIRYARKLGREIYIVYPGGNISLENPLKIE